MHKEFWRIENLRSTPHILVNPAVRGADQRECSTILIETVSRNADGLNYRLHFCVFTPSWGQFQSSSAILRHSSALQVF